MANENETDQFAESMNKLLDDGNKLSIEMAALMENKASSTGAIALMLLFDRLKEVAPDIVDVCTNLYRQSKVNLEAETRKAALLRTFDKPEKLSPVQ